MQPNYVKRENTKPHNPYTYNKKNFHQSSPDYGTKEFNKMYNADDGWVMGFIQRDIDNMQKFLNGDAETVAISRSIPKIFLCGGIWSDKYSEYMKKLWQAVQQKIKNEEKSFYLIFVANYSFDIRYKKIAHFKKNRVRKKFIKYFQVSIITHITFFNPLHIHQCFYLHC